MLKPARQMLAHIQHMVLLDVGWVGYDQRELFVGGFQFQRCVLQYRKMDTATTANNLGLIPRKRAAKVPQTTAADAALVLPAGTEAVVGAVQSLLVAAQCGDLRDWPEPVTKQVQAMATLLSVRQFGRPFRSKRLGWRNSCQ